MRTLLLIFFTLFNYSLFSQITEPFKFLPSTIGNVWEYSQVWGYAREELYKDSVDEAGNRYLFYTYNDYYTPTPRYKIDSANYTVKWLLNREWTLFKLDSDSGDIWIVDSEDLGSDTVYKLALCKNHYIDFFHGHLTTFKVITYYQYQQDTVINQFSWPENTITLAYGIGEVMNFDEGGAGPQRILEGCIIDGDTVGIITAIEDEIMLLNSFNLYQNYPNPFNPNTTIKYSISEPQQVKLTIYTILGEEKRVLVNEYKTAGIHSEIFNAEGFQSGVYIYTLTTESQTLSKKLVLLK